MNVEELIGKYDAKIIKQAAERLEQTESIRSKLLKSRWSETPLIFESTEFLLPAFEGYRPLAVTLHSYGLYIEPIYVLHHSGKPDRDFALHINESEDGLRIYVEDAFDVTLEGNYEIGFKLNIKTKENTTIISKELRRKWEMTCSGDYERLECSEREHCEYCGAFLSKVPVIWKTEYGDIEATALECRNPRCPETKSREKRKIISITSDSVRICPKCNGSGQVEDTGNHLAFTKTCELCDGAGKIPTNSDSKRTVQP